MKNENYKMKSTIIFHFKVYSFQFSVSVNASFNLSRNETFR